MDLNKKTWLKLKDDIMNLNKKNYALCCQPVISQVKYILINTDTSNTDAITAVLSIIYECSLREILHNSFPVSAYLMETLTSGVNEMEQFKPLINGHLRKLQENLTNFEVISCHNVGVLGMLLCIFKLSKLTNQDITSTSVILIKVIEDTNNYVKIRLQGKQEMYTDLFVLLLYCVQWYAIKSNIELEKTAAILEYFRKNLSETSTLTTLGKVLSLDILEQSCKCHLNVEFYQAIYSKYLQGSESYLLTELKEILSKTPFPLEPYESSNIVDDVFQLETDSTAVKDEKARKLSRARSIGTAINLVKEDQVQQMNGHSEDISETWTQAMVTDLKVIDDEEVSESIKIPERCVSRVFGLEGAIKRKIELDSSTTVIVTRREDPERPESSSLTAHRLITNALGVRSPMPDEKLAEEKQKLISARVKRQNEKNIEPEREIIIEGLADNVKKAKEIIDNIITKVETLSMHLDITVDELLDKFDSKLKTIEQLLNVYLEIEEQEDNSVVIKLSGDIDSCRDGKKLIFDEVGTFKTQTGRLFALPKEMFECFKNVGEIKQFIQLIRRISTASVRYFKDEEVTNVKSVGYVFVTGTLVQINKAIDMFQKTNVELLCCKSEDNNDEQYTHEDLCDYVRNRFDSSNGDWRVQVPSLRKRLNSNSTKAINSSPPSKRKVYTREELIEMSRCPSARVCPTALVELRMDGPSVFQMVIFPEGIPMRDIEGVMISLSTPMLSTYDV